MSKTKSLHHIVFATKYREMTIAEANRRELYAYIYGIIHSTVAIADLVKEIKQSSNYWMKTSGKFPKFRSWGEGYYAFSIGISEAENVKNYIMNQEAHHARNNFLDEMRYLAEKYSVAWYPADWE